MRFCRIFKLTLFYNLLWKSVYFKKLVLDLPIDFKKRQKNKDFWADLFFHHSSFQEYVLNDRKIKISERICFFIIPVFKSTFLGYFIAILHFDSFLNFLLLSYRSPKTSYFYFWAFLSLSHFYAKNSSIRNSRFTNCKHSMLTFYPRIRPSSLKGVLTNPNSLSLVVLWSSIFRQPDGNTWPFGAKSNTNLKQRKGAELTPWKPRGPRISVGANKVCTIFYQGWDSNPYFCWLTSWLKDGRTDWPTNWLTDGKTDGITDR